MGADEFQVHMVLTLGLTAWQKMFFGNKIRMICNSHIKAPADSAQLLLINGHSFFPEK
jgi:hypothetical protein